MNYRILSTFLACVLFASAQEKDDEVRAPREDSKPQKPSQQVSSGNSTPSQIYAVPRDISARNLATERLAVQGRASFKEPIQTPGIVGDCIITGSLKVTGDVTLIGNFNITGTTIYSNKLSSTGNIEISAPAGVGSYIVFNQTDPAYEKARISTNAATNQGGFTFSVNGPGNDNLVIDAAGNTTVNGFLTAQGAHLGTCGPYSPSRVVQFGSPSVGSTEASTCRQVHTVSTSIVTTTYVENITYAIHIFPAQAFAAGVDSSGFFIVNVRNSDKSLVNTSGTLFGMVDVPSTGAGSYTVLSTLISTRLGNSLTQAYTNSSLPLLSSNTYGTIIDCVQNCGYSADTALLFVLAHASNSPPFINTALMQMFAIG